MSGDGFIHRFVPAVNSSTRTLLLLHGTGGDEDDLLPLGRSVDPDAAMLSPRGKVMENGHARFFRRLSEGVFDEQDVIVRAHELADFVVAAAAEHGFDISQLTALGYSNGANIAAAMLLLRPEVLANAILLRAMVPLARPPAADLGGRRVLISIGEFDPIVPPADGERLGKLLESRGANVTVKYQRVAHNLASADVEAARNWLGWH